MQVLGIAVVLVVVLVALGLASYCRPTAPPDSDLLPGLPADGPNLATIGAP